jgi:hypothetical protein
MVFSYYNKLSAAQKRIYRRSDEIPAISLPDAGDLHELAGELKLALETEDRVRIEEICRKIAAGINARLSLPPVRVNVLAIRPAGSWGELHGLYETAEGRASAKVTLWMRTVKHKHIVAFRSFLRTLLHELCHHIDYELFKLADSFHTEGFYKRESSLFHQIAESRPDGPAGKESRSGNDCGR